MNGGNEEVGDIEESYGSGVDVVVPVESIRAISTRFANTVYGFFLGKRVAYPVVANYVRNTWEDVGNVPVWVKLHGVPVTAFSKDGLSAIATKLAMIELRADVELKDTTVVECPKNPGLGAGASETKNPKKTSQTPKGFPIGPKMAFKPNQEYRPVTKKHTANSSSNKKKGVNSTSKVSDSNLFEVLNSVDNDVEMGTNRGTSNLDKIGVNSSGSSFWNVKNSSTSTTPIMDKIGKFEDLIIDGKATLVDEYWQSI
ncbi:hypothetical protein Tco_0921278 [Tanacetum coccineum]